MSDAPDKQAGNPAPAAFELTPAAPKKRRGRPPGSKAGSTSVAKVERRADRKPETPQQRIDRLKVELQKAEADKAALEQQRDLIVGRVVVAHALANPDYGRQLASLLRNEVKAKSDLAVLGELLA